MQSQVCFSLVFPHFRFSWAYSALQLLSVRFPKSLFTNCMAWPLRWWFWRFGLPEGARVGLEVRGQANVSGLRAAPISSSAEPLFFLSVVISFRERFPLKSQIHLNIQPSKSVVSRPCLSSDSLWSLWNRKPSWPARVAEHRPSIGPVRVFAVVRAASTQLPRSSSLWPPVMLRSEEWEPHWPRVGPALAWKPRAAGALATAASSSAGNLANSKGPRTLESSKSWLCHHIFIVHA